MFWKSPHKKLKSLSNWQAMSRQSFVVKSALLIRVAGLKVVYKVDIQSVEIFIYKVQPFVFNFQ